MDDPLSYPSLLILAPGIETPLVPDSILAIFFFAAAILISALERSASAQSTDEINQIESKHGLRLLARFLRNGRRLQASFLIAKYVCFISLSLLFFSLIHLLVPQVGHPMLLFLAALMSLASFFLSFLASRTIVSHTSSVFLRKCNIPVLLIHFIFLPLTFLFMLIARSFGNKINSRHPVLSMDELSRALDLTENALTNSEEHKLLKGIVTFGTMDITRIMKPKMDIVAFDFNAGYRKLISDIMASGYSRIPVCRENIDQIVGVLYIKDLLSHLDEKDSFNWQALLRPCFFIPENKKPDDLLREFQHKKTHLAIVVDEFGQTTGLVTLEDIIEEIVGEINDEFDDDEIAYSKLDDQNFIFEGKTSMNDFLRIIGRSEDSISNLNSDADTLSGFIIEQAGRFPQKNDKVNWEYYTFSIESADSRRIKRVKVTIRKKPVPA